MIVTLESTSQVVYLNGILCRVWEGKTASGIPCHAYVRRIAVANDRPEGEHAEFERELLKQRTPSPEVAEIPLRLIL